MPDTKIHTKAIQQLFEADEFPVDELTLSQLVARYRSLTSEDIDAPTLRRFLRSDPAFSVGMGANPKVRRLKAVKAPTVKTVAGENRLIGVACINLTSAMADAMDHLPALRQEEMARLMCEALLYLVKRELVTVAVHGVPEHHTAVFILNYADSGD